MSGDDVTHYCGDGCDETHGEGHWFATYQCVICGATREAQGER
ncbi:hypothetical protein [Egibacter rhizosphaerae]|nr:hypothetical protein [Egibacter rhizosphaerae]